MGHPTGLARAGILLWLICSIVLVAGCASIRFSLREPGVVHKTFADKVAREYHCDKRPLPFFEFEKSELVPEKIKPGREFNHRIVYVLCPERPTGVISGKLHTRILNRGEAIKHEVVEMELQEGRWVVDTFITLPESAEPGAYAMQVTFDSDKGDLETIGSFVVLSK